MLLNLKKFTVSVSEPGFIYLENKIKELDISPITIEYCKVRVDNYTVAKVYYKCMENPDTINKLMDYLENDYTGIATIIF